MALLAVPWTIKPVFGLLSDFVPLFGSRRRSYLLLANGVAAASLLLLAFIPLAQEVAGYCSRFCYRLPWPSHWAM